MSEILALILPLFGLILIGYVAGRVTKRPIEAMGWLNVFIVYVALPALFFRLLSRTPVEKLASWGFIGTNIAVTFAVFALTFALALATSRRMDEATIQGLAGSYGNIGYMGPALAILAFGERAAVPVALIFCFENVMHFVNAPALMALSRGPAAGWARLAASVLRSIVLHPFILATMAGVGAAFAGWTPPAPVENLIAYLAQAAAPCALFAMGVTLALRPLRRVPVQLGYIVPMKLIVHPLAMYLALGWAGGYDPVWTQTAVLMAAFTWIIAKTSLGRSLRACEQDSKMASLLGINVDKTISITFILGAALAAVSGFMFLLYYGVIDFYIGFLAGVKAFTAAVLGGIGSLPGAMLGGLLIGLIETFWSGYFSVEYKDVAAFLILAIVLIFRPSGLLGKPEVEKV